jgi:Asp-tRNA(Asn)/Glu-tRNA(Gln) amidotransferase A subunit family amidase
VPLAIIDGAKRHPGPDPVGIRHLGEVPTHPCLIIPYGEADHLAVIRPCLLSSAMGHQLEAARDIAIGLHLRVKAEGPPNIVRGLEVTASGGSDRRRVRAERRHGLERRFPCIGCQWCAAVAACGEKDGEKNERKESNKNRNWPPEPPADFAGTLARTLPCGVAEDGLLTRSGS